MVCADDAAGDHDPAAHHQRTEGSTDCGSGFPPPREGSFEPGCRTPAHGIRIVLLSLYPGIRPVLTFGIGRDRR